MAGKRSKNGTRMKAMGGGAMMKKKNYAKGGKVKPRGSSPDPMSLNRRIPKAEQERFKDLLKEPSKSPKSPKPPKPFGRRKRNKVDEAMKERIEVKGGGAMKKKNYAKGGPARTKMANGGKMVKGPYS